MALALNIVGAYEAAGLVMSHWLSTRYAIEFLGLWEKVHNPDFNVTEFRNIRNEASSNGFVCITGEEIFEMMATLS